MHDIRFIRNHPEEFDRGLRRLGEVPRAHQLVQIDAERRRAIAGSESALAERNTLSKQAGSARSKGDNAEFERLRTLVAQNRDHIARLNADAEAKASELRRLLLEIPNLPMSDVPDGADESANLEVRRWGNIPEFGFRPVEHFEIRAVRGAMDFEAAAKLSGSRFMVLVGDLARVHRALAQFMIDRLVSQHGLTEVWTPVLVRSDMLEGTGQLPKFKDDSYRLEDGKWLIPTAEVTLTNLASGMILEEDCLPLRYCAHTQCFRSEAGAAGKDTAGMLRQHQFEKVEMVSITAPDGSETEQTRMRGCAEAILEALELPYRTVVLCTGDMGFSARRTYDLEVWLPGQNAYREISSVSTCGEFQSRRMNARFRPSGGGAPEFLHTLNGSGLAVGRALIAVLENGQKSDGSVALPPALRPYLGGCASISAAGRLAE